MLGFMEVYTVAYFIRMHLLSWAVLGIWN